MANADFKKKLKASKDLFKAARERVVKDRGKSGAPEFEDGLYLARVDSADMFEKDGVLKVLFKWKFEDDHAEYAGKVVHDYQGITSEDNLYHFGRRLEDLGYEMPDDPVEIIDALEAIVKEKKLCKIRLRTKGDWQNTFLQKVYEVGEDPDDEDAEEAEEADEAPAKKPAKGKAKKEEPAEEEEAAEEEEEEAEEEEEEEAEEEETEEDDAVELAVDMKVIAVTSKGERKGTVLEILDKENLVRVKTDDGKILRVPLEKIIFDEAPEEEEEVEEKPAPKAKKKAAEPEPAKKPAKKR